MEKKSLVQDVKQIGDPKDRVLRFCISDETPDRDGDIINVEGWDESDYLKNPVFLVAHQYKMLPVARCIGTSVDRSTRKKYGDFKFGSIGEFSSNPETPSEHALLADTVYNAYVNKYLFGVSVGLRPVESKVRDDMAAKSKPEWSRGRYISKAELLEVSAAPVPVNPNAVIQAAKNSKSMGDDQIKILEELMETKEPKPTGVTPEVKAELEAMVKGLLDEATAKMVPVEKAGAKLSAATKAHLQKGLDDMKSMLDEFTAKCNGVMAHYKGLMDGDGSEPAGNSTTETAPQTEESGDVPPTGKSLDIDLESIVYKGIDSASADK